LYLFLSFLGFLSFYNLYLHCIECEEFAEQIFVPHTTCLYLYLYLPPYSRYFPPWASISSLVVEMISETNDLVSEANNLRNLPNQLQLPRANKRCSILLRDCDLGSGMWYSGIRTPHSEIRDPTEVRWNN